MNIPHYAISTLTQLLRYNISVINNKILIEHLEHFATGQVGHDDIAFDLESIL